MRNNAKWQKERKIVLVTGPGCGFPFLVRHEVSQEAVVIGLSTPAAETVLSRKKGGPPIWMRHSVPLSFKSLDVLSG